MEEGSCGCSLRPASSGEAAARSEVALLGGGGSRSPTKQRRWPQPLALAGDASARRFFDDDIDCDGINRFIDNSIECVIYDGNICINSASLL
ncbi:hypothetical protein E2562_012037 [Oryza meyeriana var. granulata]|uniref:Uncharacterized protein n=1 Tax=Oryza meyeriana var. granulata TaxID=110450 RepID=A0A6G1D387_9ORYZ|nr:hypothetical protein E2562_012037 [Oryza meyeriana var. granulata]